MAPQVVGVELEGAETGGQRVRAVHVQVRLRTVDRAQNPKQRLRFPYISAHSMFTVRFGR